MMTGETQFQHEVIMMRDDTKTNIQVRRDTRNALAELGSKDDTFDDIIRKLTSRVYDWDKVHVVSVPFSTRKGIQEMDVIVPKVDSMNVDRDEFADCIFALCEDKGIEILDDDQVPFFNKAF